MKVVLLLCGLFSMVAAYPRPEGKEVRQQGLPCLLTFELDFACSCDNGKLIADTSVCDGKDDCGDGSDERSCGGGGSCFSAGTKVTLASGEEMAIEKQTVGLNLLSNAGEITTITTEYVENEIGAGGQLFGINDDEPFATTNHPFWTTDGWKCLNRKTASEENPEIEYGILQIGDTVFRMAQANPLLYEPITINQLAIAILSEPSKTYGLHLNGPQSYHANGYMVAANYPILTEKRVHDGMKKLSNGEKESLKSAIGSGKEVEKVGGKWAKAFYDSVNSKTVGNN